MCRSNSYVPGTSITHRVPPRSWDKSTPSSDPSLCCDSLTVFVASIKHSDSRLPQEFSVTTTWTISWQPIGFIHIVVDQLLILMISISRASHESIQEESRIKREDHNGPQSGTNNQSVDNSKLELTILIYSLTQYTDETVDSRVIFSRYQWRRCGAAEWY